MSSIMPGRRSAALRDDDVRALETTGARVWQWPITEVCSLAAGDGWSGVLAREGYAPGLATETWYDDGGLVVACEARAS